MLLLSGSTHKNYHIEPAAILKIKKSNKKEKHIVNHVWFVWFYSISTIVGYLIPNPVYTLNIYDS